MYLKNKIAVTLSWSIWRGGGQGLNVHPGTLEKGGKGNWVDVSSAKKGGTYLKKTNLGLGA
jgi:hypothetical protein